MANTILIIEDNANMADNIAGILELANYKVISAPNGKIGTALAQQHHPDLILCDIMMPELDGYGVLHILSSNPDTSNIPFIFVTAKADKTDFRTGMNLGADDYITKPFDDFDLLKVVETRLRKAHQAEGKAPVSTKDLMEFEKLVGNCPVKKVRKKELLFLEFQSPNSLFVVKKGSMKTYKINSDGKEFITGIHNAGAYLGYTTLLEEKPYNENAEALETTEVYVVPKDAFLSFIYSNKEIAQKFIKMISANLDESEKRMLDLAYHSVRQRVAGVLLQIEKESTGTSKEATITVARKDLANLIGTAVESLNRTLSDFKEERLIDISDEGIKIVNRTKLEHLVQ